MGLPVCITCDDKIPADRVELHLELNGELPEYCVKCDPTPDVIARNLPTGKTTSEFVCVPSKGRGAVELKRTFERGR